VSRILNLPPWELDLLNSSSEIDQEGDRKGEYEGLGDGYLVGGVLGT
jgi:hypothetical protein